MSRVFSPLAKGCGTWTGGLLGEEYDKKGPALPLLTESDHRHGFTVTSRTRSALINTPAGEREDGQLVIPKTYVTRKGAMVLFSAPENVKLDLSEKDKKALKGKLLRKRNGDIETKFGTLARFTKSVLAFGDDDYPPDDTSISDPPHTTFLHFVRSLGGGGHKEDYPLRPDIVRPGSDIQDYLRDLLVKSPSLRMAQSRSTTAMSIASRIAREIHEDDMDKYSCHTETPHKLSADAERLIEQYVRPASQSSGSIHDRLSSAASKTSQRSHQVLSSEKLAASLKSANYLGRPYTAPQPTIDSFSEDFYQSPGGRPLTPSSRSESVTSSFSRIRQRPSSHGNVSSIRKSSKRDAYFTGGIGDHSNAKAWIPNRSKTTREETATVEEIDLVQNDILHENIDNNIRDRDQDISSRSSSISSCSLIPGQNVENDFLDEEFGLSVPTKTLLMIPYGKSDQDEKSQRSQENLLTASRDVSGNKEPPEITQGENPMSFNSERKTTPSDQRSSTIISDSLDAAKSDFNSLHDDSLPSTISVEMHDRNAFVSPSSGVLHDSSSAKLQLTGTGFFNARIPSNKIQDNVSDRALTSSRNSVARADSRRSLGDLFADDRGSLSQKEEEQSVVSESPQVSEPPFETPPADELGEHSKPSSAADSHDLRSRKSGSATPGRSKQSRQATPILTESRPNSQHSSIKEESTISNQASVEESIQPLKPQYEVVPGLVAAPAFDSRAILETEIPQNEEFRDMEYIPQIEELQFQDNNGYEGEHMLAAESLEKFEARDSLMNTQDLIEPAGEVNGIDPGIARIELAANIDRSSSRSSSHSGFPSPVFIERIESSQELDVEVKEPIRDSATIEEESTLALPVENDLTESSNNVTNAPTEHQAAPNVSTSVDVEPLTTTPTDGADVTRNVRKVSPTKVVPRPPIAKRKSSLSSKVALQKQVSSVKTTEKMKTEGKPGTKEATGSKDKDSAESRKEFVQALNISSKQPPEDESPSISINAKEEIERMLQKPSSREVKVKKCKVVPSRQEPVVTKTQEEEDLDKFEKEMNQMFRRPSAQVEQPDAGLSLEEMEIEQQILKEKMAAAEAKLQEAGIMKKQVKFGRKTATPKLKKEKVKKEPKRDLQAEKLALKEQRKLEKEKRLEEAKKLQTKIKEKDLERQIKEEEAEKRKAILESELQRMAQEAEFIKEQEEEARIVLAAARAGSYQFGQDKIEKLNQATLRKTKLPQFT